MIFSGWILPDLYEIPCVSCSTNKGHIQIVKSFLENLKKQDSHTFSKIQNKLDELTLTNPYLPLDDFAVVYLGWIKVLNVPCNLIFIASNSPIRFLSARFARLDYNIILLNNDEKIILTNIPSKEIFNP